MELRLLTYDDIDITRWDAAVRSSYNAAVYGMSWYLDACFTRWGGLVYGDYEQVMCVPLKEKLGVSQALQPLFVQQCGIFSQTPLAEADVKRFLTYLDKKVGRVQLYLTPQCTGLADGFDTEPRYSQYVSLLPPMGEIRKAYSDNVRRNIKKAAKAGVGVRYVDDFETVVSQFKNQPGSHVGQIGEDGFKRLEALLSNLKSHTQCLIPQVSDGEGNLLYTAFFSVFEKTVLYVKGAGTEAAKNTGAGHWMMDHMMQTFQVEGCTVFDFGGANAENVRKFNRQFGGGEFEYLCFNGGYLPSFLRKI